MLPLSLLRAAVGHPMFVELKNGETYNGHLVNSDAWMNMNIRDVICTSRDGDRFWQMTECYIRGNTIKYLRVPEEVRAERRGRGDVHMEDDEFVSFFSDAEIFRYSVRC